MWIGDLHQSPNEQGLVEISHGLLPVLTFLDKGKVPILFSVEQMRSLRMKIEHTPVGEFLTCPLFGMQSTALAVSTPNHPVLDIMALATSTWKPMCSFQSEDIYMSSM